MKDRFSYISWFLLALAVLAAASVMYASFWLRSEARARGASTLSAEQRAEEAALAVRVKTLVQETAADRARLESVTEADIVTIASAIESTGRSVGVSARVNTAVPSGDVKEIPGGAPLRGLTFIIASEGSFSGIMQFIRALEKFPNFAQVDQLDIERVSGLERTVDPWRASIRITIFTTSDIAS